MAYFFPDYGKFLASIKFVLIGMAGTNCTRWIGSSPTFAVFQLAFLVLNY